MADRVAAWHAEASRFGVCGVCKALFLNLTHAGKHEANCKGEVPDGR